MKEEKSTNELIKDLVSAQAAMIDAEFPGEIESGPIVAFANAFRPYKAPAGRRKAGESLLERFMQSVVFGMGDCWYWRRVRPLGYGACELMGERLAHRVSWRIHYGDIPEGKFVLHKCDVRNCVNPEHLFLGTYVDNRQDCIKKKRNPRGYKKPNHKNRGENHPGAILTNAIVRDIRTRLRNGEMNKDLAKEYGVSSGMIGHIAHNRAWKNPESQI